MNRPLPNGRPSWTVREHPFGYKISNMYFQKIIREYTYKMNQMFMEYAYSLNISKVNQSVCTLSEMFSQYTYSLIIRINCNIHNIFCVRYLGSEQSTTKMCDLYGGFPLSSKQWRRSAFKHLRWMETIEFLSSSLYEISGQKHGRYIQRLNCAVCVLHFSVGKRNREKTSTEKTSRRED